jgi:ClpP class serine protease
MKMPEGGLGSYERSSQPAASISSARSRTFTRPSKNFVAQRRPSADIAKVANGDVWLASEALSLGLVDALSTGDDLLFRLKDEAPLFEVATSARKWLLQQLLGGFGFEERALAALGAIGKAFGAVRGN